MKMKPKKFLYREWAEEWLLNKKDFVKESTYANYATVLYNHLIPDLGETSLQSVNHNMLQQYILDKLKSGRIGENSHLSEKNSKRYYDGIKKYHSLCYEPRSNECY